MNCAVCLEDNVREANVHYMECLHYICDNCFGQLLQNSCPLCRQEITLLPEKSRHNNLIEYDSSTDDESFYSNEFFIPHIRRDRHENKRKKNTRKKEHLNNIILSPSHMLPIPNSKKRINKKIKLYNVLI